MCLDIKQLDDRVIVKLLRNPNSLEELQGFLTLHKKMLEEIKVPRSKLLFFDVRALYFDVFTTTVYVPVVLAHFIRMRSLSDEKLRGCAVCVSNGEAASLIQRLVEANPGKVKTLISQDEVTCKNFLKQCRTQ